MTIMKYLVNHLHSQSKCLLKIYHDHSYKHYKGETNASYNVNISTEMPSSKHNYESNSIHKKDQQSGSKFSKLKFPTKYDNLQHFRPTLHEGHERVR